MTVSSINPQDVIFSLDIGTRSVIATAGVIRDKKFHVIAESYIEHKERAMIDGQIHDINLVAETVNTVKRDLEGKLKLKLKNVAIAAAGRFLRTVLSKSKIPLDYDKEIDKDIIRSLELTAVRQAEEKVGSETYGKLYCVGYSVKNYYLNGFIISNPLFHKGENIEVEIIATFLPRYVVESLYSVMDKVGLNVISLTLEPIAAMEAVIPGNLRMLNLALVDIGAGTSDIAISSKDSISAYGMVSLAGDEVTEAIAHNYLVDFNTAEIMKRKCSDNAVIKYMDIMGFENEVSIEEMMNVIEPVVDKIAGEISSKIMELNGNKAPNAVFLVGGGAHTPLLKEKLTGKLNIPPNRIGIKGRESIPDCVCSDFCLGSEGVTVLGIALVSIKQLGHDFIDVILNGNVISMFNSHKHTVMDVLLQAGINPKLLIGRNGKNIKFHLNGVRRIAFGTLAKNAEVTINEIKKSIDSEIKEGDKINIEYAMDGKDAEPSIKEFIKELFCVSFYMNDDLKSMEPMALLNGSETSLNYGIKEGDSIEIIYPKTLGDYKKYFLKNDDEYIYRCNDAAIEDDYNIKEGDRIYRNKKQIETPLSEKNAEEAQKDTTEANQVVDDKKREEILSYDIKITVNEKEITLSNKQKYIFVDIFSYVEFDLSKARGSLKLLLNGKNAGYYDELSEGDMIRIFWDNE